MRLPGFSADASLYKTSRHYRMIARFGQAGGTICPMLSISDLVKSSLYLTDLVVRYSLDSIYVDRVPPISVRGCCQGCLSSIPCADESCRRQRSFSCTRKCGAEVIGGCECPPGRVVCASLRADGECCKLGLAGCLRKSNA